MRFSSLRVLLVLATLLLAAPHTSARDRCSGEGSTVNCGYRCTVYGGFSGYCNWTSNKLAGCVQLESGCGSMEYVDCCDPEAGEGSF